ncbi:hypothetical protein TNCV_190821 [Trichonephila clavipes]|nr:hypothetical protein TNCV_190821 [Trichonephila clavipes]
MKHSTAGRVLYCVSLYILAAAIKLATDGTGMWKRGQQRKFCRPSGGIVVSDTDCCAVGRRATSPLEWLVAGDEKWEDFDPPPGCSPSKLGWKRAKSYCHLYSAQGYGQRQAHV